ncbi:MAG: type II secretion system F family protein [Candidatus Omnitrophica bacterium]|nr:type II secretion system F family protein [Candidatus Omnitrophota bacterium]
MGKFKYAAKDNSGNAVTGTIEAKNRAEVIDILRKKDVIIVSVSEQVSGFKFPSLLGGKKKVKLDDIVIFSRQLATMVDAGIPLVGGLDILGEQMDNKTFAAIVVNVRSDVEAGASLSDAMSKQKNIFSSLFVNMVKAGESSGMLDEILDRLAEYLEKTSSLQKKVKSALVYPAIVSLMAIGITFVLLWKVVPVFRTIFEGFGAELPMPTRILLSISDALQKFAAVIFIGLIAGGFMLNKFLKTEKGRFRLDSFMLKMPIFGILFRKVAISKFTRTLATLIKSGVPILASLEIVSKTSGNKVVEKAIDDVRTSVKEGESIAQPLARSKIFPPMVTRMVLVGEQSGQLEKMLSKIADFYDEQVDSSVSALTSLIEPLIIAFLGIVIGSIVICMFLPIFKITAVMGV